MFTNLCVPWKTELFRIRVGTEREESEREAESAVPGAKEPPAPSCVRKQKSEPKNSVWSTTSESARGMSPFRFGTMAELGEAPKVPFQVRQIVGTCPRASRKCPLSCTMSECASDLRGMSAFRFGTASRQTSEQRGMSLSGLGRVKLQNMKDETVDVPVSK
jgi:hypothetical protein